MNRMKKVIGLCLTLLLLFGIAVPAAEPVSAAPSLSGQHLSSAEKRAFTRILKREAGKKEIDGFNAEQAVESWKGKYVTLKKEYSGYDTYTITKSNGKNVLLLCGEIPEDGTVYDIYKLYWLKNGKVHSYRYEGYRLYPSGYSSKGKGIAFEEGNIANIIENTVLTYQNGKIGVSKKLSYNCYEVSDWKYNGKKISKSKYDKIYDTYYENCKEIKFKEISDFK